MSNGNFPQRRTSYKFPDWPGKFKFQLLDSFQQIQYHRQFDEHELFYRVCLDAKNHMIDPEEDEELLNLINEYRKWKAEPGIANFVTRRDPEEWFDEASFEIPGYTRQVVDAEREVWSQAFGRVPMRFIGGHVCLDQLRSERREWKQFIVYYTGSIPARLYECGHPDPDHWEECIEDCTKCKHLPEKFRSLRINKLDSGQYRFMLNIVLDHLADLKSRIEEPVWHEISELHGDSLSGVFNFRPETGGGEE